MSRFWNWLRGNLWLTTLCRVALAGIFIYASFDKIAKPAEFAKAIDNYHILPTILAPAMAVALPYIELIVGICLLVGFLPRASALILTVLLLIFSAGITNALIHGYDISCGCFTLSPTAHKINVLTFLRDSSFILLAIPALVPYRYVLSLWNPEK